MSIEAGATDASIRFRRVVLVGFRNFERVVFEPGAGLNVIAGDNGQGKTSLLEALYFVATTRSFRAERLTALVRHGSSEGVVKAEIVESGSAREQRAAIVGHVRQVAIDGKRPSRLVDYALRTPVVAFHPGDLSLVAGSASGRRRLLDRVALFVDPAGFAHKAPFERAIKERARALEERGERALDLSAYEALASEHGARFQACRENAARALVDALMPAFGQLAPAGLRLEARYLPGGSTEPGEFQRELAARRSRDRARGSPSFGPGKDDLELALEAQLARTHGSQGQQRILTLGLKLAELGCIATARRIPPVLLLDDVSSELDSIRTEAVYEFLSNSRSQIFVTTPRPELFPTLKGETVERRDFNIEAGRLRAASHSITA